VVNEVVVFLGVVNHANHRHQHYHREEKRGEKLDDDVFIEQFHKSQIIADLTDFADDARLRRAD
jgi:hypothetical protein